MNVFAATVLVPGMAYGGQAQAEGPDKLVTLVTAAEPQTQLMAMVLTMNAIVAWAQANMLLSRPAGISR
jgi:hypothetical protein